MVKLRGKRGLTLVEILMAVVLMSITFLAVSALYVSSQMFYFAANNKVIISYELQYAVDHIYKYAMQGIGDVNTPAISVPGGSSDTVSIRISANDPDTPLTSSNYNNVATYTYSKLGDSLTFSDGVNPAEPLVPKITITDVTFSYNPPTDNLLTISLTAQYKDQELTFYSACYPRLASFQ